MDIRTMTTTSPICDFLDHTNIQYARQHIGNAATWRWPGPIVPVCIRPAPATYALNYVHEPELVRQAIDKINRRLAGLIELKEVASAGSAPHIAVTFGTSYRPENLLGVTNCDVLQNWRANVSKAKGTFHRITPNDAGHPQAFITYMNIGIGPDNLCKVDSDLVIHEFGHALGFAEHFEGFGSRSGAISEDFWNVLATLYSYPPLTPLTAIQAANAAP